MLHNKLASKEYQISLTAYTHDYALAFYFSNLLLFPYKVFYFECFE